MSEAVTISLISAASGIAIAWIVNVAAKKVQKRKEKQGPVDRMEQMFNGYERLIKQKDLEDERKARLINELEEEIKMTREMVRNLEETLAHTREELAKSIQDKEELKDVLKEIRKEYHDLKKAELEKQKAIVYSNESNKESHGK